MAADYFISDVHLGIEGPAEEEAKEERLAALLDSMGSDGARLFINGDLFDFWFEYRRVVPGRGLRVLAALHRLALSGVAVHYLTGNHDFALGPYLSEEVGCIIHEEPFAIQADGRRFYLHHGDGLAKKDTGYRVLKKVVRSGWAQALWRLVHPDLGLWLARKVSGTSRQYTTGKDYGTTGYMDRRLEAWAEEGYDVIFLGHTHHAEVRQLTGDALYVNLGTWLGGGAPWARYEEGELLVVHPDGSEQRLPVRGASARI